MSCIGQQAISRRESSACRQRSQAPVPKPLPVLCRAASLPQEIGRSQQPFGGAIVARLAGSSKILKGEHYVVPLLGPGLGTFQPELPFGASVECVMKASTEPLPFRKPPVASLLPSVHKTLLKDAVTSSRMLDVLYVLAGTGIVTSSDGLVRKLHAGDSLVAWHNTTELWPISTTDQPPAVLKFHFPASVLMLPPGIFVAPAPSHADLQVLVDDCRGNYEGELTQQEAADMLSGVQQRTSQAIAQLYGMNASTDSKIVEIGNKFVIHRSDMDANGSHDSLSPRQEHITSSAPSAPSNNLLPVISSFFTRLLRMAVSAQPSLTLGGFHILKFIRAHSKATDFYQEAPAVSAMSAMGQQPHHGKLEGSAARSQHQAAPYGCGGAFTSHLQSDSLPSPSGCVLLQRALEDFKAFRFPRQTNKLAFVFDPSELGLSLSFGVEVFEPGHHTPLHIHRSAHELFFVLAGEGVAFCNGQRFPVRAGDCVVFPPRAAHGIDNTSAESKLYCLQLMTPNESFVEHVKSGEAVGRLDDEDLCNLTARHC